MLLLCRYIALLLFGMYAGVWRYASARDALRAGAAVVVSGPDLTLIDHASANGSYSVVPVGQFADTARAGRRLMGRT